MTSEYPRIAFKQRIYDFFQWNLLERLVIYLIVSRFIAFCYVEIVLGEALFYYPRLTQWLFYGFLFTECLVSIRKIWRITIGFNVSTFFVIVLLVMLMHGVFIGFYRHNALFTLFNDVIPILMIALNVLRMQSASEQMHWNAERLFSIVSAFVGMQALLVLLVTRDSLTVSPLYFGLFAGSLLAQTPIRWRNWLWFLVIMAGSVQSLNRSSLLFLLVMLGLYLITLLRRNPSRVALVLGVSVISMVTIFSWLPQDSKLYQRIQGTQNIDLNARSGSVGERQQEWESINTSQKSDSITADLFGLGMGGTFYMRQSHGSIPDYGHAHYSWAWFKLRFGDFGFIYLGLMIGVILINIIKGFLLSTHESLVIAFLGIASLIYCLTYVNAVFLMMGVQFFYLRPALARTKNQTTPLAEL